MVEFSIIVPVYNVENYLTECIESILIQTYRDFELILIDDGSTDNSPEICDKYSEKDSRIRVIHKTNGGVSSARNVGLDIALGKYILFIDSDDGFSREDALLHILGRVEEWKQPDILSTKYGLQWDCCKGNQALLRMMREWKKTKKLDVVVWDKVYRREYLTTYGFKFMEGLVHEDLYWTLTVLERASTCVQIDEFYFHRESPNSITRAKSERSIYNRAVSKLSIAEMGVAHFEKNGSALELKKLVYEFYMGIYLSGILEGHMLEDKELKKKFIGVIDVTDKIFRVTKYTERKLYKFLGILKRIWGINVIRFLLNIFY